MRDIRSDNEVLHGEVLTSEEAEAMGRERLGASMMDALDRLTWEILMFGRPLTDEERKANG